MITPVAYLKAQDPVRNIYRAYSIAYGQDLFGNSIVETTYGRIGGKGRTLISVVNNEDEALKYVQKSLKCRQSAPKRIGVAYKIRTTLNSAQWSILGRLPAMIKGSTARPTTGTTDIVSYAVTDEPKGPEFSE
ncbi:MULTISPECIES: WGR domain-containing protein [Methylomicrobium]|uniref:WGR domain-containing protein n=1 Tax=Methylomicrobium TaxID=39773 RepID=UPI0002623FA7|nr:MULTISPECIES: WGR domain-containing protein [Methylomicrobium]